MLAIAFTTQYSGTDVTLGLAFTRTGVLVSVLRGDAGLAGRGADRQRYVDATPCSATCSGSPPSGWG